MTQYLRRSIVPWAVSRLVFFALGALATAIVGAPERGVDPVVPRWIALFGGWDTSWYLDIARNGYATNVAAVGDSFTNFAFFPLLPGVMAAGRFVGINPFWTAVLAANLGVLVALMGIDWLTRQEFGPELAGRSVWVLAFVPTGLFSALPYTEGLVLAFAVLAAVLATRGMIVGAGLVAALAALARPPGILVAVLVVLIAWRRGDRSRLRAIACGAGPAVAAFGVFLVWMQHARGSWSLPLDAQRAWGRGQLITGLWTSLPGFVAHAADQVIHGQVTADWTSFVRDVAALVFAIVLVARLARRVGWRSPWTVYSLLSVALPFSSGSPTSLARFSLMAFPLVWPLTDWVGADQRRQRVLAGVALGLTALLVFQLRIRSP